MEKVRKQKKTASAAVASPGAKNWAHDPFIHLSLLIAACFVTYWNTLQVPFTFDDSLYILDNPLIRSLSSFWTPEASLKQLVNRDVIYNMSLRPVAYFTFTLNYVLAGANAGPMHMVNTLTHVANTLLVYWLIRLLLAADDNPVSPIDSWSRAFIPFFTAMLFAVHPIQTQAVTYIVQRFTSLVALFYLLSLCLYLLYRQSQDQRMKCLYYAFSLVAAVAAMKTKENAFTLPLAILLVEFLFYRARSRKTLLLLLPFLMTMLIIPLSVLWLSGDAGEDVVHKGTNLVNYGGYRTADYLITQFRVLVTYLRLLIFPANQNLDYDFPLYHDLLDHRILFSLMLLLCLLVWACGLLKTSFEPSCESPVHRRLISFGIFWFFLTIAVESSVIPLEDLIVEHRLYLPAVGILLAAIAGLDAVRTLPLGNRTLISSVAVSIVLVLSVATVKRNDQWKDIWEDVVRKSPGKIRAHQNLGVAYLNSGRHDLAIPCFRKVIAMQEENLKAHLDLAISLTEEKQYGEAEDELAIVLRKEPRNCLALEALGIVHLKNRQYGSAARMLQQSLELNPDNDRARKNLSLALQHLDASLQQ